MVNAVLAQAYWVQGWDGEWRKVQPDVQGRYREVRESGRVGPSGDRTMHARVSSIGRHTGGVSQAIRGLAYDKREGRDHRSRVDELESSGGRSTAEMTELLEAVDKAVTRKNGKLALDYEIELPIAMTPAARRAVAERIAEHFETRGVPCHWAVHSHNERGDLQPHLHMTTTARAVVRDADGQWQVTTRGGAVIDGPIAMQQFRREVVARAINEVAAEHIIDLGATWHGGRLAETGIDRPAQRRRPMVAIKREAAATADDRGLAVTNAQIASGDYGAVIDARARFVERAKEAAVEREKERAKAREATQPAAPIPDPAPRQTSVRAVRTATAAQRRLILVMAQEAGVTLPDGALDRLDGGDLMAAVKLAKVVRAETRNRDKVIAALSERLDAAEQRVMAERDQRVTAEEQAQQAVAELHVTTLALNEMATTAAAMLRDASETTERAEQLREQAEERAQQAVTELHATTLALAEAGSLMHDLAQEASSLIEQERGARERAEELAHAQTVENRAMSAAFAEKSADLETARAEKRAAEADRDAANAEVTRISEAMQQRKRRYMDASKAQADAAATSRRLIAQLTAERDALVREVAEARHQATQPAAPPTTQADRPRPQAVVALHGTHTAAHKGWIAEMRRDLAQGGEVELSRYLNAVTQARAATDPLRTAQLAAWDRTRGVVLQAAADLGLQPPGQRETPAPTQAKPPGRGRGG